jgi:hypothetical protein
MINNFLHKLDDSFRNWFEYELLTKGSGYRNVSGLLYSMKSEYVNKSTFSNPYSQFVYDASISGANIPSGVYSGDGTFIPRGQDGLAIDFEKGRAIFNSGVQGPFTATYASKEFNIYFTTHSDAGLLFQNKINFRPKFTVTQTGIDHSKTWGPAIFIKRTDATNEPYSIGGEDCSHVGYRAIILSDNEYDVDAVGSIFMDAARKNFSLLDNPPLNRYGDIRSGDSYNYLTDVAQNFDQRKLVCITNTDFYRFDATSETALDPSFRLGFVEFQVELPRFPRI